MGDIVTKNDNPLWFMEESTELIDYSEGDLSNQIFSFVDEKIMNDRKDIVASLVEAVPAFAEIAEGLKKTEKLKLVFSDEVKKKLEDGTYHLMKKKDADGVFKAIVVDGKGKIKAQADLKWEELCKGVDPARLTLAMQGMAIQQQLRAITEQLNEMSETMEEVLMGQYSDRLALFYSGEAIYREALATKDPERRKQLISAAILSLTNSISSLQANLAFEIRNVCDKYDEAKGRFVGIKTDKLKDKMFLINSSFQTIHKAMTLKTAIYYQEGEYEAVTRVLTDYKSFLERSLTEDKAHVLYLADPNEKNISGAWNLRQNELPIRIEKTRELLLNRQDYALECGKGDL